MPAPSNRSATLTGSVKVNRPPQIAIDLFTAEGERSWVEGWDPTYPDPALEDATEPRTVWQTRRREGRASWVVATQEPTRRSYAFLLDTIVAGMVAGACEADGDGSIASVRYDATAPAPEGGAYLRALATGLEEEMLGWAAAIADLPFDAPGDVHTPRPPTT